MFVVLFLRMWKTADEMPIKSETSLLEIKIISVIWIILEFLGAYKNWIRRGRDS